MVEKFDPNRSMTLCEFRYVENMSAAKYYDLKNKGLWAGGNERRRHDPDHAGGARQMGVSAWLSLPGPKLHSLRPSAGANWPILPGAPRPQVRGM